LGGLGVREGDKVGIDQLSDAADCERENWVAGSDEPADDLELRAERICWKEWVSMNHMRPTVRARR
jgi:hypothetical protein